MLLLLITIFKVVTLYLFVSVLSRSSTGLQRYTKAMVVYIFILVSLAHRTMTETYLA
jgi:hypothetical protein